MRIVLALGGNALGKTPEEQKQLLHQNMGPIADLVKAGHELVLSHGNGPQVGMINLAFMQSNVVDMPFAECGAMSQGYIGYHMQTVLRELLGERNIDRLVISLVTQVEVSPEDPAFKNPNKPVGRFYNAAEAEELKASRHWDMREDSGRGWRRVVPSPQPVNIIEIETIRRLIEIGQIVIAVGGGGIPVCVRGYALDGLAAVIDKDLASAKLAEQVDADLLFILTAVDHVCLNYGTANERVLAEIGADEIEQYQREGHFAAGSMGPKVEAAIRFVRSGPGRRTIITSLDKVQEGLAGLCGTQIHA